MKKYAKQIKWDIVVTSAFYIVLGIVAIAVPDTMLRTLGYMIGSLLILAGAVSMICYLLRDAHQNYYRNEFLYGLVGISIGIIVLYKVEWIVSLVPVIMGLMVLISGCRKLQDVIDMKRMEYGNWIVMLALAAINVIFGVVLILNPFETMVLLLQLVGVGLIFSGISDIVVTFYFAGKIKEYFDRLQAVDSTYVEVVETGKPKKGKEEKGQDASKQETKGQTAENGASGILKTEAWNIYQKEAKLQPSGNGEGRNQTAADGASQDGETGSRADGEVSGSQAEETR